MNFYQPASIDEAVSLAGPGSRFLAGGTDLVLQMREGKLHPKVLIDLGKISELADISEAEGWLRIGSMATFSALGNSSLIRNKAQALWLACQSMGSPQIRNRATLGGNLGNNSPAADGLPPLLAMGAMVRVVSQNEDKLLPVADLLTEPLNSGQLIVDFRLPVNGWQSGFAKLGRRKALAIARLSVALGIQCQDKLVTGVRVAFGAVGLHAFVAEALSNALVNQELNEGWVEKAVQGAQVVVAESLGKRPSAEYKNAAVAGVMRQAVANLALKGV